MLIDIAAVICLLMITFGGFKFLWADMKPSYFTCFMSAPALIGLAVIFAFQGMWLTMALEIVCALTFLILIIQKKRMGK